MIYRSILVFSLCSCLFFLFSEDDIVFITNPPGAGVFCEGEKLGQTPLSIARENSNLSFFLNPGKKYHFIIYKDFFEGEIITLVYQRGKQSEININLQYLKRLPGYDGIFQAGYRLDFYELLMNSTSESLGSMRNEIYARRGKQVDNEYVEYFNDTTWYKINPYYSDKFLTTTDYANLELIASFELPQAGDSEQLQYIIQNSKYISVDLDIMINFLNNQSAILSDQIFSDDWDEQNTGQLMKWRLVSGTVYLWDNDSNQLYEVVLDHKISGISFFQEIRLDYGCY